jgi:ABC-type glycerol-3-phosphate transport system permease component
MSRSAHLSRARRWPVLLAVLLAAVVALAPVAPVAVAAVVTSTSHSAGGERAPSSSENTVSSLEAAASKAGNTGRAVAMSLIGLAFAVAATVLAFRRDFKEAAGVFAVGIVSVLLATPAGVSLLRDTVASLFGSQ